ncbi:MAG: A/G-specific adenine glycosylase [Candidatus Eisenbacteria bacterium]
MPPPAIDAETARALRAALLRWYRKNRRDLPWRRTSDPYRILVSETMLQQTRVSVAIPYYERFTSRFPDPASLAAAPLDEVLALWAGLGYYRRARHLKSAAEKIVSEHGGRVPDRLDALLALPGVGRYTAGAILSIAHGRRAAVLDGNVFRVLARFFARKGSWRRAADRTPFWDLAEALVPEGNPGELNQALMELGALVCVPRAPDCPRCPLRARCEALRLDRVDRFPVPPPREQTEIVAESRYVLLDGEGRVLLVRRPERGRMGGLWDLPDSPPGKRRGRKVGTLRHSVLRFRYVVDVYRLSRPSRSARGGPDRRWAAREELESYALTGMARKALAVGLPPKP